MLTAVVNDTAVSQNSSGKVVEAKANAGEFDLAMAAVQALLTSIPIVSPQAQNGPAGGKASVTGADGLNLIDPTILVEGLSEDAAVKKPGIGLQGSQLFENEAAGDTGKEMVQPPEEAKLPPDLPTILMLQPNPAQATVVAQNRETGIAPAVSGSGKSIQQLAGPNGQAAPEQFPLNAEMAQVASTVLIEPAKDKTGQAPGKAGFILAPAQNDVQMPPVKAELDQTAQNGVKQGTAPASEKGGASVSPEKGEMKPVVQDRQEVLKASPPGNVSPPAQPPGPRSKDVFAVEMVGGTGKEAGVNPEKNGALKTNGTDKTEAVKSGGGTELARGMENSFQPSSTQSGAVPLASNSADNQKSVALPDLKDRLVQEMKHIFTHHKGEPQTQVQLKLEPEHLGPLTVKLFYSKGELSAHFYTGNNYVKEILEGSLQQLRDSLGQQELRLNEAFVFSGDDGRGGMGRYFEERNGQAPPAHGGYHNRTHGDATVESADIPAAETVSSRVNYLV